MHILIGQVREDHYISHVTTLVQVLVVINGFVLLGQLGIVQSFLKNLTSNFNNIFIVVAASMDAPKYIRINTVDYVSNVGNAFSLTVVLVPDVGEAGSTQFVH